MSLLEDVFLQDEAGEAQELERVIEGDEFERVRSDSDNNSEREDEAEEDKRRVDPSSTKTRRVTKNPRFTLNPARLTGPRGIQVIPDHFKDFKFKGKGHEKEDLDLVLKKLEHWAYRLYPKFKFEDCLKKIETLGKKRPVMVHLHKIRTDQYITEETVTQKDSSNEEEEKEPEDEFDKLLQQQIELARSTPAPDSVKKHIDSARENRVFTAPVATSSPTINNEQRERMLRNRKLAEERRLARLKSVNNNIINNNSNQVVDISKEDNGHSSTNENNIDDNQSGKERGDNEKTNMNSIKRINRSNVIDSSDDDAEITTINTSITVDIHKSNFNEQTHSKSNEDNSNNILRMDTDSDTDVQNDNDIANTLNNYVNDESKTRQQSKVNDNEDNENEHCDPKKKYDKTHNNNKDDCKIYEENDNKDDSTVNNKYDEHRNNAEILKENSKNNDKTENINNEIVIDSELLQKEIVNEELMDINFDDEF